MAVPQSFFKIGAPPSASDPDRPDVMAYLFPHDASLSSGAKDQNLSGFLVSVNTLEMLTDLDFFANLPDDVEAAVELRPADAEWPLLSP